MLSKYLLLLPMAIIIGNKLFCHYSYLPYLFFHPILKKLTIQHGLRLTELRLVFIYLRNPQN